MLTLKTPQRMYEKRIKGFIAVIPFQGKIFQMNTMAAKSASLISFGERLMRENNCKILWISLGNPRSTSRKC